MMWLTWRQFRPQAIAVAAVLAVLAVVLVVSGLSLAHLFTTSGIPACHVHHDCESLASGFLRQARTSAYSLLHGLGGAVVILAPAVIGMFWGAPLITREIETGTFRLAWNQSVSRDRWIVVKLGLIGLAPMVAAAMASLMVIWWVGPINRATVLAGPLSPVTVNRFTPVALVRAASFRSVTPPSPSPWESPRGSWSGGRCPRWPSPWPSSLPSSSPGPPGSART